MHQFWIAIPRLTFFSEEPYSPTILNPSILNGDVGECISSEASPLLDILGEGAFVADPGGSVGWCGIVGYQECDSAAVMTGRGAPDQGD